MDVAFFVGLCCADQMCFYQTVGKDSQHIFVAIPKHGQNSRPTNVFLKTKNWRGARSCFVFLANPTWFGYLTDRAPQVCISDCMFGVVVAFTRESRFVLTF